MRLDTTYHINTPEGIALQLSPAGPIPRLLAWLVDLLLRTFLNVLLFLGLLMFGKTGIGIAFILMFLLEWFYPVYFELYHRGQTPGKKAFNLYVANADATPITASASLVRNILRVADFLPFMYGLGFISMLCNRRFQRLGDLAAHTVVLHKTEFTTPAMNFEHVEAVRPHVTLSLVEQQAIMLFGQRAAMLTEARLDELAVLTTPLVSGAEQSTQELKGIAMWLNGGRA